MKGKGQELWDMEETNLRFKNPGLKPVRSERYGYDSGSTNELSKFNK